MLSAVNEVDSHCRQRGKFREEEAYYSSKEYGFHCVIMESCFVFGCGLA